jgi:predicted tellurium resistance membrane protein TerC
MMTALRESALVYPVVMSLHLTAIAVFGGMILATNLRLLGLAFMDYPVTDLIKSLRPFKHAGLTLVITCGLMLGTSEADKYYPNPYFWVKMTLLMLAIVHALAFRRSVYKNPDLDKSPMMPANAKLAGVTSLLIWSTIACMGRLIAYSE